MMAARRGCFGLGIICVRFVCLQKPDAHVPGGGGSGLFNSPFAKAGSVFFFLFSNTQPDWQQHTVVAPSWKVGATVRLLDGQNAWTIRYDVYPCYPIPPLPCLQSVCLLFVCLPPSSPYTLFSPRTLSFLFSLSLSLFFFFFHRVDPDFPFLFFTLVS